MNNFGEIIRGVRQNNYNAQMQFYDLFAERTYRSACAILSNAADAEEIMQDTMLKIFTKTDLLCDDETIMQKRLCRIAINASIDFLRLHKRNIFEFSKDEKFVDTTDESDNFEEENALSVENIKRAVSNLAAKYKVIVSLRLFEEMTFDEIAEQLKILPSTVRCQYSRGIEKVRNELRNKNEK